MHRMASGSRGPSIDCRAEAEVAMTVRRELRFGLPATSGGSPNLPPGACAFTRREERWRRACRRSVVSSRCRGSLKTDDTLDVRNAAAAIPAAKPLLRRRHRASSMNLQAGRDSHLHAPWPQSGPPVEESCHARVHAPECMKRSGKGGLRRQTRPRGRRRRSRKARAPESDRRDGIISTSENPRDSSPGEV